MPVLPGPSHTAPWLSPVVFSFLLSPAIIHPFQGEFAAGTRCRSNFQGAVALLLVSLSLGGSAVGPPPGATCDSGLTYCLASEIPTNIPLHINSSSHIHMMI